VQNPARRWNFQRRVPVEASMSGGQQTKLVSRLNVLVVSPTGPRIRTPPNQTRQAIIGRPAVAPPPPQAIAQYLPDIAERSDKQIPTRYQ
jgi:hypothetical protein